MDTGAAAVKVEAAGVACAAGAGAQAESLPLSSDAALAPAEAAAGMPVQAVSLAAARADRATALAHRQHITTALRQRNAPLTVDELAPLCITMADFVAAVPKVQPAAQREGFAMRPDVTWADIGALEVLRGSAWV